MGIRSLANGGLFAPLEGAPSIGSEGAWVFGCDGYIAACLSGCIHIGVSEQFVRSNEASSAVSEPDSVCVSCGFPKVWTIYPFSILRPCSDGVVEILDYAAGDSVAG